MRTKRRKRRLEILREKLLNKAPSEELGVIFSGWVILVANVANFNTTMIHEEQKTARRLISVNNVMVGREGLEPPTSSV